MSQDQASMTDEEYKKAIDTINAISTSVEKYEWNLERLQNRREKLLLQAVIGYWKSIALKDDFLYSIRLNYSSYEYDCGMLNENLTNELLKLDGVISNGNDEIRTKRKDQVKRILFLQEAVSRLHEKAVALSVFYRSCVAQPRYQALLSQEVEGPDVEVPISPLPSKEPAQEESVEEEEEEEEEKPQLKKQPSLQRAKSVHVIPVLSPEEFAKAREHRSSEGGVDENLSTEAEARRRKNRAKKERKMRRKQEKMEEEEKKRMEEEEEEKRMEEEEEKEEEEKKKKEKEEEEKRRKQQMEEEKKKEEEERKKQLQAEEARRRQLKEVEARMRQMEEEEERDRQQQRLQLQQQMEEERKRQKEAEAEAEAKRQKEAEKQRKREEKQRKAEARRKREEEERKRILSEKQKAALEAKQRAEEAQKQLEKAQREAEEAQKLAEEASTQRDLEEESSESGSESEASSSMEEESKPVVEEKTEEIKSDYNPRYQWLRKGNQLNLILVDVNFDKRSLRCVTKPGNPPKLIIQGYRMIKEERPTGYYGLFYGGYPSVKYIPFTTVVSLPDVKVDLSQSPKAMYYDDENVMQITYTILQEEPKPAPQRSRRQWYDEDERPYGRRPMYRYSPYDSYDDYYRPYSQRYPPFFGGNFW